MTSERKVKRDAAGKQRLQFVLSDDAVGRIDKLSTTLRRSTRTSTVRLALGLLEALVEEVGDPRTITIVLPDGTVKHIRVVTML